MTTLKDNGGNDGESGSKNNPKGNPKSNPKGNPRLELTNKPRAESLKSPATDYSKSAADFAEFVRLWHHGQGFSLPKVHRLIINFLIDCLKRRSRYVYLVAFRNSGKSTLMGLFAAWMLRRDPNLRILILTADILLSCKMVRHIRSVIEDHPHTDGLKTKLTQGGQYQWTKDQFTVARSAVWRDPSVLARALNTNYTGSRADIILCDDIEVPSTCNTSYKRRQMRDKLTEMDYVLSPGGMIVFGGTPHTKHSIYYERN